MSSRIFIFSDGAANKYGAGWGVYWEPPFHKRSRCARLPPGTTNQAAELAGLVQALRESPEDRSCEIWTDSDYALKCLTVYIHAWQRNGWLTARKKPVKHQELIQEGITLLSQRDVVLHHIKEAGIFAHSRSPPDAFGARIWAGNERADELAKQGSRMEYKDALPFVSV